MPYFYLRNSGFIALFRTDKQNNEMVAELVCQSKTLDLAIKDRNLTYTVRRIYEDQLTDAE